MKAITISKAAKLAGVGVETIRFYERKRLIEQPPKPVGGGYREYPAETVQRIRFIRQAQHLGFSLREAADLLSLQTTPETDCGEIRARAAEKRAEVRAKIHALENIQMALDGLIAACPGAGTGLESCSILQVLERAGSTDPSSKQNRETVS